MDENKWICAQLIINNRNIKKETVIVGVNIDFNPL